MYHFTLRPSVLTAALLVAGSGVTRAQDVATVLAKAEKAYHAATSFRADFTQVIENPMLGGPERRSLFMLTAAWRGTEGVEDVITARTGQVLVVEAPAPGVGWP